MIDLGYYINVYDLMMMDLPRPTLKKPLLDTDGEEIPIILLEAYK